MPLIMLRKVDIMSIYICPCCGKKGFNPYTKGMAGQLNSKGKPCKVCGKRCVNGKGATIFNAVYCLLAFIAVVVLFLISQNYYFLAIREIPLYIVIIFSMFAVPRLVNAFFFKMTESIRLDI